MIDVEPSCIERVANTLVNKKPSWPINHFVGVSAVWANLAKSWSRRSFV